MARPSTTESPALPKYIPQLDGLRALAIIGVMLFHQHVLGFNLGWAGVQLFFVLSGFLITGILLDTKNTPHYFRNFYFRRIIRIFPVYYLGLAVVIVIARLSGWGVEDVWHYVFYIQNHHLALSSWKVGFPAMFDHTWSLAIEEQFYILWPLIVYALDVKKLKVATILLFVFAILSRTILLVSTHNPYLQYMLLPTQVDTLAAGAFLAIVVREGGDWRKWSVWSAVTMLVSGVCILALVLYTGYDAYWHPTEWANSGPNLMLISLMAIFFASLISTSIFSNSVLKSVLELPWLIHIGRISYGLYLFHYPIFVLFNLMTNETINAEPGTPYHLVEIVLAFGATYLVALLSWKWFESPLLKYKDRYR
jgi:peptidoglycan/LPS O-acetylase OafA/YrhL